MHTNYTVEKLECDILCAEKRRTSLFG